MSGDVRSLLGALPSRSERRDARYSDGQLVNAVLFLLPCVCSPFSWMWGWWILGGVASKTRNSGGFDRVPTAHPSGVLNPSEPFTCGARRAPSFAKMTHLTRVFFVPKWAPQRKNYGALLSQTHQRTRKLAVSSRSLARAKQPVAC